MNIGFVAHDAKKILMQNFCIAYRGIVCKHSLYATASTGRLIEEATGLQLHKFLAGHLGGTLFINTSWFITTFTTTFVTTSLELQVPLLVLLYHSRLGLTSSGRGRFGFIYKSVTRVLKFVTVVLNLSGKS